MVASQISQEAIDFVTENESNMKEFIAFSKSFHEQCGCLSNSCKTNTFITSLSNFFEKKPIHWMKRKTTFCRYMFSK